MTIKLEKIVWNGKLFWTANGLKKVNPTPIGDPTQIIGITDEQRSKNVAEIIEKRYKDFGINAYSQGIVHQNGFYSHVFQFYKI